MTYDATAALNYSFDQENRITGANGYTYTYDGDGNRVIKSNGNLAANGTLYWAMTPGVVAETDLAGTTKSEYVFFGGERVARRDGANGSGGVFYYFSDHLKTASVVTDSAGSIKSESDFYPWGGELQFTNNDSNHYKFTGKERDGESSLDYFGARYYSNGLGRWVSADWSSTPIPVPYADFADPQSLNLYNFVGGNPASKADPDGHDWPSWQDVGNFVAGATNAIGSDNLAGTGRMEGNSLSYTAGQAFGDGVAIIQGNVEVDLGIVGLGVGTSLIPTGAGTAPGLAIDAGSAVVASHGAITGGTAALGLGKALVSAFSSKNASKGPKAKDAPGVTSNGQATDEHGNKLGPSGDEQVNTTTSNTRETAGNKALNEGTGKVEHRNPKVGKRHFHPRGADGKKKPSSTHHEF
jgi:RHS repeat-associated protein